MSQRGVLFYRGRSEDPKDWVMNGLVPPLVMELKTDTLVWCTTSFAAGYPEKVRTQTLTNDRYLLKNFWCGPYVKMSRWCESGEATSDVYEPLARKMESTARVLKNVLVYYRMYDVLHALDYNPNLHLDLTKVDMSVHTSATFKIDAPSNLNDPNCEGNAEIIVTDPGGKDDEDYYNPAYDKFGLGLCTNDAGTVERTEPMVTINSRLLSGTICSDNGDTLKDTMSRVPAEMRKQLTASFMKKREEYRNLNGLYYKGGVVPSDLPGVKQPQQSLQVNRGGDGLTSSDDPSDENMVVDPSDTSNEIKDEGSVGTAAMDKYILPSDGNVPAHFQPSTYD